MGGRLRAAWRRAGRRGLFLLILTAADITYGTSLLQGHAPAGTQATMLMPARDWGFAWLGVAAVLATGVLASWDRWQFAVAAGWKLFWAGAIIAYDITTPSHPGQYGSAVAWLALAAVIVLSASWPDP